MTENMIDSVDQIKQSASHTADAAKKTADANIGLASLSESISSMLSQFKV